MGYRDPVSEGNLFAYLPKSSCPIDAFFLPTNCLCSTRRMACLDFVYSSEDKGAISSFFSINMALGNLLVGECDPSIGLILIDTIFGFLMNSFLMIGNQVFDHMVLYSREHSTNDS
jgi:hypothetical protein